MCSCSVYLLFYIIILYNKYLLFIGKSYAANELGYEWNFISKIIRKYLIRVPRTLTDYLTYNLLLRFLWLQADFLQPNKDPQWAALHDRISSLKWSALSPD